jgi:uncharacterized protein YfaS (alpha-2-macroglobulin family)
MMRKLFFINLIFAFTFVFETASLSGAAWAQKAFTNEDLASDSIRLETQIKKDAAALANRTPDQLRKDAQAALARKDAPAAAKDYAALLAPNLKESAAWLVYSRALIASGNRYDLQLNATTAAYIAYQRAATKPDEAAALAWLGQVYAEREMWRPSLNAYRASLDTAELPGIRKTYEEEREKYGFRILDYKVDNESAAPRACFQFSDPLARGKVDFAPYIAVSGASNAAISSEDQQLCVEGLKHGEHYAVVVRQGLPSAVGEALLKSADYEIYVRDRSPQVHFTGKNYVLPRVGQEGIPVVSVNTQKLQVDVIRIGDRNLLPTVRSDDFLQQLSSYRVKHYVEEDGVKIWSGTLDVKSSLNQDVTTAFPVLEAVGKMEPGVYVMVTKPADGQPIASDDDDSGGGAAATQWFVVSDLGLTAFSSADGVHVFVRSLANAAPIEQVELRLVARNNEVLAAKSTGADGHVRFDPGLSRGTGGLAPNMVVAQDTKGDYGFLDLGQTPFDLTDRGVKGRTAPVALDAEVFTERGVYRAGETVFVTMLLRDAQGVAATGLPLTLVVKRPDGVEYKRTQIADEGAGGRSFALPLLSDVATGTWAISVYADPKGQAIGDASFLVEDYVPERLDFTVKAAADAVRANEPIEIAASTRYLYGAPGADLEISGEVQVHATDTSGLPALKGFQVGLADESFENVNNDIEEPATTDAKGNAKLLVPIPDVTASRPLEAKIILRAGEPGGRAVERTLTLPILPKGGLIGVKKNFDGLGEGAIATFDVIAVGADGKRAVRKGVAWSLYKVNNDYQWYNQDGRWGFERIKSSKRIAEGKVDLALDTAARISAPVALGQYRLDVASDTGTDAPTSVTFFVGWSGDASADTPDLLDVTIDKTNYKPGENIALNIASRFAGKATIAVVSEKLHYLTTLDVQTGDNKTSVPVGKDWGTGAYLIALVHRPLDKAANRMPGRALGLAWFALDEDAHKIGVTLAAPEKVTPRGPLTVPVAFTGLDAGEEAYVTLAAVDIGILNLTHYETPDPHAYFLGQKQLSTEIRDLYGLLIDGMQGTRGEIRSGGDGAGLMEGNRPTQEPLARYSGVVKVGPDGKAQITFDLPAFNGSVRLMAAAWSKTKVGNASMDVIVRDSVVMQATVPRFLALGDRSQFHLQLDNVEGKPGDYTIDLDLHGPLAIGADALHKVVKLDAGARASIAIPVIAAGIGPADVDVKLTGPGLDAPQSLAFNLEAGTSRLYRRDVRSLAPGASLKITDDLIADVVPGTGAVSVSVSPFAGLDVPALLQELDRYPYGCSEQTVSRAMPLLYVNKIATAAALSIDTNIDQRIRDAIDREMARQDSTGAFGLWSADSAEDMWLNAYVTDFLTRARENNFAVPQKAFDLALEKLRNHVANATTIEAGQSASIAYAAYVLARNGRPVMGDLRYLADTQLDKFDSPLARAQLAAALALLGDRGRALTVFNKASESLASAKDAVYSREDYGSRLRDGAGLLALAVETGASEASIHSAVNLVEAARAKSAYTSTQENAWMVLAAEALAKEADAMSLSIDGVAHKGSFYQTWRSAALEGKSIVIANSAQAPVRLVLTTSGNPTAPEPAAQQGYQIERAYYSLAGKKIDPASIKQNDRFVVTLKVTENEAAYARLLLVDPLPAGLEIDNPDLFDGGSIDALSWLKKDVEPTHTEYRDDRFVAAFARDGSSKATFSVAYIVRAVTPGHYVQPPATIEDMYRPQRFGRTTFGSVDVAATK